MTNQININHMTLDYSTTLTDSQTHRLHVFTDGCFGVSDSLNYLQRGAFNCEVIYYVLHANLFENLKKMDRATTWREENLNRIVESYRMHS